MALVSAVVHQMVRIFPACLQVLFHIHSCLQKTPHHLSPLAEFQYPSQWLADQTLAVRAAQRAERMRSLDLPALDPLRKKSERDLTEPISAFGPPGSSGEENGV